MHSLCGFAILALAPTVAAGSSETMSPALEEAVHEAILEERYRVAPGPDECWQAANPAQGMSASFSPSALEVSGVDGDGEPWTLGLRLESWGRGSSLTRATGGSCEASGRRVEIRREGLIEWYLNDERGLEQGFTILSPPGPAGSGEPLELLLALEGGFTAEILAGERDARLTAVDGTAGLSYSGLRAWDADGRELEARLSRVPEGLAILVDDRDASYPLTVDPWIWVESGRLEPFGNLIDDWFGWSISMCGDTALIGAPHGLNQGVETGAAYVFVRNGAGWTTAAKLLASAISPGAMLGWSVSISGDTALIGAPRDGGVGSMSGSAYVFVRNGASWSQQAKLTASDAADGNRFGASVAILGDRALIGSENDDAGGIRNGSVYAFTRSGSTWTQQAKLTASDALWYARFGSSVSLYGYTALIGAQADDTMGKEAGAVYAFVWNGSVWSQEAKLTAMDGATHDYFGSCVSLIGDTALVGAWGDDHGAISSAGSAYVFVRYDAGWSQQAKLVASDLSAYYNFGCSVSLSASEDLALIGAKGDKYAGWGTGSAYLFARTGTTWSQEAKLTARDGAADEYFGNSVFLSGDLALIGANRSDYSGWNTGTVYEFKQFAAPAVYCTPKVNSHGCVPAVGYIGTPTLQGPDDFELLAQQVLNEKAGLLIWGLAPDALSFGGGTLCVSSPVKRVPPELSGGNPPPPDCSGTYRSHFSQQYMAQQGLTTGTSVYAQFWSRDPGFPPPSNIGLTDALHFVICP